MKLNSFDLEHALLASAKGMIEALGPVLAKYNADPAASEWHTLTVQYRALKAAVAQYEIKL
jgi:hypothetical protein